MALDMLLVREGQKLAAADPVSLEALESIKLKETVTAVIREVAQSRPPPKTVRIAIHRFSTSETIRDNAGLVECVEGGDGIV